MVRQRDRGWGCSELGANIREKIKQTLNTRELNMATKWSPCSTLHWGFPQIGAGDKDVGAEFVREVTLGSRESRLGTGRSQ